MYTFGYSHHNSYCKPSPVSSFGFGNKANTNMNSTAQYVPFDTNAYDNRIATMQDGHFGSSTYDIIDLTTNDIRFGTITPHHNIDSAHDSRDTQEQKISQTHDVFDSSASFEEYVSAGSSISRILDDVMSVDTFPCLAVPLTTEDKIVNWLDIPLNVTCIHTSSSIDDEDFSLSDDWQMDSTTQGSLRTTAQLFTPVTNTTHRQSQWHFDIDSVERDEMSIDTVKTWSLSENSF